MLNLTELESMLGRDASLVYWNKDHLHAVFSAISYDEMGEVALDILRNMPQPISQVCGPISTGGYDSIEKNIDALNRTILKLVYNGKAVFNQIPFEGPMQDLKERSRLSPEEARLELLKDFYLPVFESGLVRKLYFIHGWESSFGARWENEQAERLGIEVKYLEKGFHTK